MKKRNEIRLKMKKKKNNYSTKIKFNVKEKNSKNKKENQINKKQNLRQVNPLSFNKDTYFIVSLFYLKNKSEDSESK